MGTHLGSFQMVLESFCRAPLACKDRGTCHEDIMDLAGASQARMSHLQGLQAHNLLMMPDAMAHKGCTQDGQATTSQAVST